MIAQEELIDDRISMSAQERIDGSLVRVVEILGVFVALIAVVATAVGALHLEGLGAMERGAVILAGLFLPLGYFLLLKLITQGRQGFRSTSKASREPDAPRTST